MPTATHAPELFLLPGVLFPSFLLAHPHPCLSLNVASTMIVCHPDLVHSSSGTPGAISEYSGFFFMACIAVTAVINFA